MAREPQEIYDAWYDRQDEKIDDYFHKIYDVENPDKKLALFDEVIKKAEKLVEECKKREQDPEIYDQYSDSAIKNLENYKKEKQRYLDQEYQEELIEYQEELAEREREKVEQKQFTDLKKVILSNLQEGEVVTLVDLESQYGKIGRVAAESLVRDGKVVRLKVKGRIAIQRSDEANVDQTLSLSSSPKNNKRTVKKVAKALEIIKAEEDFNLVNSIESQKTNTTVNTVKTSAKIEKTEPLEKKSSIKTKVLIVIAFVVIVLMVI